MTLLGTMTIEGGKETHMPAQAQRDLSCEEKTQAR